MERKTKITVLFVHDKLKSLDIDITNRISCQGVIKKCFDHVSRLICNIRNESEIYAPKYLHTFGLSVYPNKKMWVSPNHVFDGNKEKGKTFQFRVRFYPHRERINYESSSKEEPVMIEYLYLQILDDFLFGKLGKSIKFDEKQLFRILTIAFLMPPALPFDSSIVVNEQYMEQRVNIVNFKNKISKDLCKRLLTHPLIDAFWICRYLKSDFKRMKFLKKSLGYHKQMFFKELMDVEPYYWIEQYTVRYNDNGSESNKPEVTLTVNFSELNHEPMLFFGEVSKFGLDEIYAVEIQCINLSAQSRNVLIFTRNQAAMSFKFPDQVSAESFVSMLQGFFMLFVCYDVCLSSELQTPDMKIRNELLSFGPLQDSSAEQILKSVEPNNNSSSQYVIFESLTEYDHYKAMVLLGDSVETLDIKIQKMNSIDLLKNGTLLQSFDRCKLLSLYLRNMYKTQLLPRNHPGVLEINEMFQVNMIEPYGTDYGSPLPLNIEPGVYLREDLEGKLPIADKNPFIRKYKVVLKDQLMMLVELQTTKSEIAEGFHGGIEDVIKLHRLKPESFLKFYGFVCGKKLCFLIEYAPFGDLLTYICQNPQTVSQKVNIMYQIVNILGFLEIEKVFHGNIRSRKCMVFGTGNTLEINIKLGDSGISHYLDTLPLSDPNNIERLPWLSPERRRNLTSITYESECYAVGTTLCEIIYRSDQFYEEQAPSGPSCFMLGSSIPKPSLINPQNVDPNSHNTDGNALVPEARQVLVDVWDQIIVKCWSDDPQDRPPSYELLQILNEIRKRALNIKGDTNFESIKEAFYDSPPNPNLRTIEDLEKDLEKKYQHKYLLSSCIWPSKMKLGQGHFGVVYKGQIRPPSQNLEQSQTQFIEVAIKTFKKHEGVKEPNLIKEICLACDLDHPNIVKVSHFARNTCSIDKDVYKLMLIMEYMNLGSLDKFATKDQTAPNGPTPERLLKICTDVAEGMAYLSGESIVHRDLAARNVLLTEINNDIVAKVSDFGLARNMEDNYNFYRTKPDEMLPCFWMPPEVLDQDEETRPEVSDPKAVTRPFSSQSDVWSFGVTMWEAFSKGTHPFKKIPVPLCSLLSWYKGNNRLPKSTLVCDNVYKIMQKCWQYDPEKRPAFVELLQHLKFLAVKKIVP